MARIWMADYPPSSASAYDDEFDDSSVDTGLWTDFDPGSKMTASESDYGLSMVSTTNAGDCIAGIFQAVPANNWAAWTRVSLSALRANYSSAGILLGQDMAANPNTSDLINLGLGYASGANTFDVLRWNAYNSWAATLVQISDAVIATGMYLRVRKASTTYGFDVSMNGSSWLQIYTSSSLAFTPAQVGLYVNNNNTGADVRAVFQFFRMTTATPALTDMMYGQRVL